LKNFYSIKYFSFICEKVLYFSASRYTKPPFDVVPPIPPSVCPILENETNVALKIFVSGLNPQFTPGKIATVS